MKQKKITGLLFLILVLLTAACGTNQGGQTGFFGGDGQSGAAENGEGLSRQSSQQAPGLDELNAYRAEIGMDLEKDYQITEQMEGNREDYILLTREGKEYYIRRPAAREENSYLAYEGAFRFEIPEDWIWGSSELDNHLEVHWEDSEYEVGKDGIVPFFLWNIEYNEGGANPFEEQWEEVCANMEETAGIVFEDKIKDMEFNRYRLEDGNEVYHMRCTVESEEGREWTLSTAYRFGEKNKMEFIGLGDHYDSLDMGNLILYTAATYEEFGGDREPLYEGTALYKGMKIWDYQEFHNPFVLAYEAANGKVWRESGTERMAAKKDSIVEFTEPLLEGLVRELLQIEEGQIMASDLEKIESIVLVEDVNGNQCIFNETELTVDFSTLVSGDGLVKDLSQFTTLKTLVLGIGDASDYSPLGALTQLETLQIQAGKTVTDVDFIQKLPNLLNLYLEKAPTQEFVASLSEDLWERTCREMEVYTFRKEYGGEPGLAFDLVELPD
ncbi:MAG: hypothetical protein IJP31_07835 [Lachnospiraceae bacterium]|nr:hypothetical protein [Lachnospiraceae bacterium]